MNTNKLLQKITEFYLSSRDFNGIPISHLDEDIVQIKPSLIDLLKNEKIVCNFGDRHPNLHILALKPEPKEEQIKKLMDSKFCCAYPSPEHLKSVVDKDDYKEEPYTLEMMLGEPQLAYRTFNLRVLEFYRNDPRFSYTVDDMCGAISAKADAGLSEDDDIFIENFGFAYDEQIKNRYVAVYLRYISRLSPEHQQRWKLDEHKGKTFLHPDYERATMGHWPEKESIFNAFCEEIKIINGIALKINGIPLFRNSYSSYDKPKEFGFLIRPTRKEYENFVHLLDKMISENINKDFFKDKIELFELEKRGENFVEKPKGTIRLLDEWLDATVVAPDPKPKNEMIGIFREVRKERQPQAHHVRDDEWDDNIFLQQKKLIIKAYGGIRTLRLIFANHPSAKTIKVPEWLFKGEIRVY